MITNSNQIKMKRVAIYIRDLNDEVIMEKRKALIRIANTRNWICDTFIEEEKVGSTWPVKTKVLQRLRNHEYEGLMIFNLESWARNSTELILELDEFIREGMFIYSLSENLHLITDFVDPRTRTLRAFAHFERFWIDAKRKIAIENCKYFGKKLGRPQGSKDKAKRKTDGYFKREALKRHLNPLNRSYTHLRP